MSTPIDPRDTAKLMLAFERGSEIGSIGRYSMASGAEAVARAVCPEHHAVFDARTHVAVPVAEIESWVAKLEVNLDPGFILAREVYVTVWLLSLLPKEATDEA